MGFPVFFDTCALYGEYVNDLALRMAECGLFSPYWSDDVLDELERNLSPRIGPDRAGRRIHAMRSTFPDAAVHGYEPLVESMTCDRKDRHVLAAAFRSPANTLVTFNTRDFPTESLEAVGMEIRTPDDFMLDVLDLDPAKASRVAHSALLAYKSHPQTPSDYIDTLAASGLPGFARHLYPMLAALYG